MNLYFIPFFAIGRRITFTVEMRYRGGERDFDDSLITFDSNDSNKADHEILDRLPELVDEWSKLLGTAISTAVEKGYTINTLSSHEVKKLLRSLKEISWLVDVGYGERAAAPNEFFKIICEFANKDTYYLRGF